MTLGSLLAAPAARGTAAAPVGGRPSYVDSRGVLRRCRFPYPADPAWSDRTDGVPPACKRCGRPIVRVVWDQNIGTTFRGEPIIARLRAWRHLPRRQRVGIIGSDGARS